VYVCSRSHSTRTQIEFGYSALPGIAKLVLLFLYVQELVCACISLRETSMDESNPYSTNPRRDIPASRGGTGLQIRGK
jgi:hypothetical protein